MRSERANVEAAFGTLWRSLLAIPDASERRIARDAVRDALDRNADLLDGEAPPDPAGRFVAGTFSLEAAVAEGGFATVFRARHRDLGTLHAVKILKSEHASDPVLRRLFLAEARHHLSLRHPALVEAFALLRTDDGRPALAMDFIEGPTLAQAALAVRAAFREEDAIRLVRRLATALAAIHHAGIAHLDVSPANILLPAGAELDGALLGDFGLSLAEGERHGGAEIAAAATSRFAAPEQRLGNAALDRRADVFALGALAEWMLGSDTGRLTPFIQAATAPDPARRLPDMEAVLAALDRDLGRLPIGRHAPADVGSRPQDVNKPPPQGGSSTILHVRAWKS